MNSKRRAELQRKLSMGAVPRPPADLSDRIKADIPQFLQAERARFSGSVAFTMRVAASILMLITTAFITVRLLEPTAKEAATLATAPPLSAPQTLTAQANVPPVHRIETADAVSAAGAQPVGEEVRLDIAQEMPMPAAPPPARAAVPAPAATPPPAEARPQVAQRERKDEDAFAFAPTAPEPAPVPAPEPPVAVADVAPGYTEGRLSTANEADARDMAKRREAAPTRAAAAPSRSLMSEAYADEFSLARKPEVFGISVDPRVFDEVKVALEAGKRPAAASVNVDALVNYFAGPPARAPRRGGVALEVEVSPAPVKAEGDQAVLRFTIDTPRMEIAPRASIPPAALDARIEIEIDPKAVANYRRIGGTSIISPEASLLHNLSVTGLYQLELKPQLQASQRVATVRLHYRSITNGKPELITRVIRGKDLARNWSRASRRHRLASLGAVWSESLKSAAPQADVARRAQELSSQRPEDPRARELANAANATAGGRK